MNDFYKSGYQYAAGALLSREKTPRGIAVEINSAPTLDSFYDGMRAALRDYVNLNEGFTYAHS